MSGYDQFFKKAQQVKRGAGSLPRQDQTEASLRKMLRVKSRPPFPLKIVAGLVISLGMAGFYLANPEKIETFFDRIEVQGVSRVAAESSAPAKPAAAKPAAKAEQASPDVGQKVESDVQEEFSHFKVLRKRKDELDVREKELGELEEELQRQKGELDKRIQQLEQMRTQIAQVLKDRVEVDQEKVTKLVDLYANMKPKQAAEIIGSINEDLAIEVLAKMKKKNAAEIMNLLSPDKAKVLSERYTGYRRGRSSEPKG